MSKKFLEEAIACEKAWIKEGLDVNEIARGIMTPSRLTESFRTRIAPSPTGDMHIGTARTAYFNWLAAKASGGKFILRIDDTDADRSRKEYIDVILKSLSWLGLDYEGPYYQSNRIARYRDVAQDFIAKGYAKEDDGTIKLDVCPFDNSPWQDEIGGQRVISENDIEIMKGMVIIRGNDFPTYNWASVIDDMDFDINYIIRGTDHITNTSKQVMLWRLLGTKIPKFAHVGLIAMGGKLLSKRDGAASLLYYQEKGYDADAFLNFLARLGWGPKVDDKTTKMLPRERMLELFLSGGNMKSSSANADLAKLEAFDRKYKASKGIWRNGDKL